MLEQPKPDAKSGQRRILEIKLSSPNAEGDLQYIEQNPEQPFILDPDHEVVVKNGLLKIRSISTGKVIRVLGSEDLDTNVVGVEIGYLN